MLPSPYVSLDQVAAGLASLEQTALARRDRRAVFLTVYGQMSKAMKRLVELGNFRDPTWVAKLAVAFANLYWDAHDGYDSGRNVARAWRIAFDTARRGSALISQDLLLGINAHINYDLALALEQVSIDPRRDDRLADHMAVNDVLRSLTDAVAARITELYAPGLADLDAAGGALDEQVTNFSLGIARENAWEAAVALANARSELERRAVRRLLDIRAAAVARLVLVPNLSPALFHMCRRTEEGSWWNLVTSLAQE